ncbi:MAG: hypothetical protein ACI9G1_000533, partial [Pirellulaceae bacterium]
MKRPPRPPQLNQQADSVVPPPMQHPNGVTPNGITPNGVTPNGVTPNGSVPLPAKSQPPAIPVEPPP